MNIYIYIYIYTYIRWPTGRPALRPAGRPAGCPRGHGCNSPRRQAPRASSGHGKSFTTTRTRLSQSGAGWWENFFRAHAFTPQPPRPTLYTFTAASPASPPHRYNVEGGARWRSDQDSKSFEMATRTRRAFEAYIYIYISFWADVYMYVHARIHK